MIRQICHITQGYLVWQLFRLRFWLNRRKVLVILAGENRKLDEYALIHLEDYVKRKTAVQAVILTADEEMRKRAAAVSFPFPTTVCRAGERELRLLHDYYCYEEYFDNVVFTYTDRPRDNLLGRLLKETDVEEEAAVCLGCYCLRKIPETEKQELLWKINV